MRIARVIQSQVFRDEYNIPSDWEIVVADEQNVREGEVLARRLDEAGNEVETLVAKFGGTIHREGQTLYLRYERKEVSDQEIPSTARLMNGIYDGMEVYAGQQLTEGSKNPHRILRIQGKEACEMYLLSEVQDVYRNQGVNIADKHFEIIIARCSRRCRSPRAAAAIYCRASWSITCSCSPSTMS